MSVMSVFHQEPSCSKSVSGRPGAGQTPQASRSTTSRPGGWGPHAGRRYREPSGSAILVPGNAPSKFQSVFPRGDSPSPLRSRATTSRSSTDPRRICLRCRGTLKLGAAGVGSSLALRLAFFRFGSQKIKLYCIVCIIQPYRAYKQNCE
jgi:hypothetical protein